MENRYRNRKTCGWTRTGFIFFLLILMGPTLSASGEALPGGELTATLYASPHHLNPAIQSGLATAFPGTQIFAGLLRYDNEWNPHPYLAKDWKFSEDSLSLTLHLEKNAFFHDGHPITSEDVAFSIMTVKALHPFQSMMAPVLTVETPSPHTLIIRLEKPHPALLLAMSPALLPILPKHVYGSVEKVKGHPANMNPVGSGPFRVREFIPEKYILLEKNNHFFIQGRPYLDRLKIIFIRNTGEEAMLFETGKSQMMISFQNLSELRQLEKLNYSRILNDAFKGIGSIDWIAFNLRKKPFDDLRVRKAMAYAIDRKFIVRTMYENRTQVETGPISSRSPFYFRNVNRYPQDFERANRLLDEAGYPRNERGHRFSFRITYIPDKAGNYQAICEYLQHLLLLKLGVKAEIDHPENFLAWTEKVANWDFDATADSLYNWGDPVIGVHRTYSSANIRKGVIWSNTQGYSNPLTDQLMEKAGSETDFGRRYGLYREFQKIITDELPVFPLLERKMILIHHQDYAGFGKSIWGVMTPLDNVYRKGTGK